MTLFAVHDATGQLTQANKVYDPEGYDKLLDDAGLSYVAVDTNTLPTFKDWYVSGKELTERPDLPIQVNKTVVKAGSDDSALITAIPTDASVQVIAAGSVLHSFTKLDADQLEISIPVPCSYTVIINLWPYKTWQTTIEAQ
jgi:hypothetical protein